MKKKNQIVALAGQPNCGKSTVFNSLTGAGQHIANYPGVTVEKKTGTMKYDGEKLEIVDLPGTYSIASFSLEERVASEFLFEKRPDLIVNVLDASALRRSLYLTFQLMEMGQPVVVEANMADVARRRGCALDYDLLSHELDLPVVPTALKNGEGKKELVYEIGSALKNKLPEKEKNNGNSRIIDYGNLEPYIHTLENKIEKKNESGFPSRWMAIKLLEEDPGAEKMIENILGRDETLLSDSKRYIAEYERNYDEIPLRHIANLRNQKADELSKKCSDEKTKKKTRPVSDRIDSIVCHKIGGPVILVSVVWLLFQLAIVQGYNLTNYFFPLLYKMKIILVDFMPDAGFISEPMIKSLGIWVIDSVIALLNYIPVFFILFALIAILEDIGYMPRMAFILDRVFRRYGLHGQSTLPMVLGGVYAGGCAVPAIMATKGIPDERARFATILIIPMLNCLAKIPLYILLVNTYFPENKAVALFFISTITILIVLPVAKILTGTVLSDKESAPFIMEMPPYHMFSIKRVVKSALKNVWLFVKKITTIVVAVAIVLFGLIHFPGLPSERMAGYEETGNEIRAGFFSKIKNTAYAEKLKGDELTKLINYSEKYKSARFGLKNKKRIAAVNEKFEAQNPFFFKFIKSGKDKDAKKVKKALKRLISKRKKLLREIKKERMENSVMGSVGRALEPVTKYAGFSWRINVALLSALAAKENSVATLGAFYQKDSSHKGVESDMKSEEKGFTPLHALALMLFMALYPPCIPAAVMVKVQTASVKWMIFSMILPMVLGLCVASAVFSAGSMLKLTGLQAMMCFYLIAALITILTGIRGRAQYRGD